MKTLDLNLTLAQKKEVYQRAIAIITDHLQGNELYVGLCWTLSLAVVELGHRTEYDESTGYGLKMKRNFPEVYRLKPVKREWGSYHHWFECDHEGTQKRIEILKKAIIRVEKLEKLEANL